MLSILGNDVKFFFLIDMLGIDYPTFKREQELLQQFLVERKQLTFADLMFNEKLLRPRGRAREVSDLFILRKPTVFRTFPFKRKPTPQSSGELTD